VIFNNKPSFEGLFYIHPFFLNITMGSIEDISIITRDKGYPKGQLSSGKNLKFIP
jgi:hypothetical protein